MILGNINERPSHNLFSRFFVFIKSAHVRASLKDIGILEFLLYFSMKLINSSEFPTRFSIISLISSILTDTHISVNLFLSAGDSSFLP